MKNPVTAPLMSVMSVAVAWADAWRIATVADGRQVGPLAHAAEVIDRLNAEGYVVVQASGIQALWHENEHLKGRVAWWQREAGWWATAAQANAELRRLVPEDD